MSVPHRQRTFNGFSTPQPTNPDPAINNGTDVLWGYPLGQDGYFNPAHMAPGPMTPMNPWPTLGGAFDVPMTDSNQRRRSSIISPRTIDTLPHAQSRLSVLPQVGGLRQTIPHFFVSGPDSTLFELNDNADYPQQPCRCSSDVSTSSSTTLVSISSSTNVDSTLGTTFQFPFFSLLLEICTEGLRRKWQEEIQRQQMQNLTARREASGRPRGYHRREPYRHHGLNSSLRRKAGRGLGMGMSRKTDGASTGVGTATEMRMMEYVRLLADSMWENALTALTNTAALSSRPLSATATATAATRTTPAPAPAAPRATADRTTTPPQPSFQAQALTERTALEKMQSLYSLSSSVARAAESAAKGDIVYNVEEVRDLVGCAARLCRMLGYWEGEATVEMCGRECVFAEDGVS